MDTMDLNGHYGRNGHVRLVFVHYVHNVHKRHYLLFSINSKIAPQLSTVSCAGEVNRSVSDSLF